MNDKQVKSPLTDDGRELVLTAANIVYDPKGVDMIKQALGNTKSEKAITPTVAMLATTILHKMGEKVEALPEEEMWGKHGVVHSVLDSIYEVAKNLGYKAPRSDLKQAYEMVDHMLSQQQGQEQQDPQEEPEPQMQQQQQDPMQPQAGQSMMGGVMPGGQ